MAADDRRETLALLEETALRVFADATGDVAATWRAAEAAGLTLAMAGEEAGGSGGGFAEARAILYAAGRHAAALPLAEALLAGWLIGTGAALPPGPLTLARPADGRRIGGRFAGTLRRVAFAAQCAHVVTLCEGRALLLACADAALTHATRDAADLPFADLCFADAPVRAEVPCALDDATLDRLLGFARACQMGGAIDAALALSTQHVMQREQFGRPLAKFQAIQQQMAVLAEEAAAANASCMAAAEALDRGAGGFAAAAASLRAIRAAGEAASIAHQVHGAIGITREYDLQRFVRRLWCWRSEIANERALSLELGATAARAGADGYWAALVGGFAD